MQHKSLFAFTRINFLLLGIALVTIFIGFILMSGSGSTDTEFNPEIFQHASHSSGADGLLRGLSVRDRGHPLSSEEGHSAVLEQTSDETAPKPLKSPSSTAE